MAPVDEVGEKGVIDEYLEGRLEEVITEYDKLWAVEDPEENPYKTKYKARMLLQAQVKELNILLAKNAADPAADRARVALARLLLILGRNYYYCEEVPEAERHFNRALERFLRSPLRMEPRCYGYIQDTLNQLGALWCGRQQHGEALNFLRRAQIMFAARPSSTRNSKEEQVATSIHLMTMLNLAQAYGGLGKAGLSARFCAETLSRQLELNAPGTRPREIMEKDPFDCKDWVRNCCGLADYFANDCMFWSAEYAMHVAIIMCERCLEVCGVQPDGLDELKAECWRDLGRIYASRLKFAKCCAVDPERCEDVWRGGRKVGEAADEQESKKGSRLTFRCAADTADRPPEGGTEPIVWDDVFPEEVFLEDEEAADNRLAEEDAAEDGEVVTEAATPDADADAEKRGRQGIVELSANERVRLPVYFRCFHEAAQRRMQRGNKAFLELRGDTRKALEVAVGDARKRRSLRGLPDEEQPPPPTRTSLPSCAATKFEPVREIFKLANHCMSNALSHFLLDGWVTEHVRILQELSQMYGCLQAWEESPKRLAAMLNRRIRLLAPLLDVLNPKPYQAFYRQLAFEVGEVYQALFDLKKGVFPGEVGSLKDDASDDEVQDPRRPACSKRDARRNELARQASKYFGIFVDTYHTDGKVPTSIEDDHLRAYLTARLHRARMRTKLRGIPVDEQVELHRLALGEYEWIVDYSTKHPQVVTKPEIGMEHEVNYCREMVGMFPTKLSRLAARKR
eukprot:TRINITY_DN20643_c0_g1_i1.p1 TRINITY_DN20643_c0_g1~~TRINITY_DN20643_c0_g1_i1.p1  ORF type:complete len:740 (+),score=199.57 TRINITY_DN20643_c0_g1_i1:108-2327(+)